MPDPGPGGRHLLFRGAVRSAGDRLEFGELELHLQLGIPYDSVTVDGTGASAPPLTCNNTFLAKLICAIAFPSTEWTAAGPIKSVTATLSHDGVVDAVATTYQPHRQLKLHFQLKHRLRHGRYRLTVRVSSGSHVRTYTRTVRL